MRRDVTSALLEWKNRKKRKPLLVTGVRQCGKTYTLQEFGKTEFLDYVYLNFDGNTGLQSVFEFDYNVDRILDEIETTIAGKKIDPGNTLVIFDEIQACPRAVSSLKYFCENKPELHVIAAGSLLGVALRTEGISFPVGKVERLEMYPMSFSEFVIADGGEKYIRGLQKMPYDREISGLYTAPMEKYLKNYYIIGGMPEVVQTWIDTHSYKEAEKIQDQILKDYPDDFGKYAAPAQAEKNWLVWDSVPVQIARENNKFIFSHVKSGARAKDLENSVEWLVNSGLIYRLCLVSSPELPLSGMADVTYFKLYMADIGLLRRKSNLNYRTILNGDENFIRFKGALSENYVMDELVKMGIQSYFWRSKSDAELDFVTDYEGLLIPIEVKSADNTKAKSLHQFCHRYCPKMAFKVSLKNVGDNMDGTTHVWSLPLYCLFRLKEYVYQEMGFFEPEAGQSGKERY